MLLILPVEHFLALPLVSLVQKILLLSFFQLFLRKEKQRKIIFQKLFMLEINVKSNLSVLFVFFPLLYLIVFSLLQTI